MTLIEEIKKLSDEEKKEVLRSWDAYKRESIA